MRRIILSFIFLLFATFNIFAEDKTSFFKSLDSISAACLTLLVVLFVFVIFSKFGPFIKEKLKHLKLVNSLQEKKKMKLKATKKPISVYAVQWTGDNLDEIKEFDKDAFFFKQLKNAPGISPPEQHNIILPVISHMR